MAEFELTDDAVGRQWEITELLDEQAMAEGGSRMHHCVRTYTDSCRKGDMSVWYVTMTELKTSHRQRVLTVALKRDHSISQIRGSSNARPGDTSTRRKSSAGVRKHYDLIARDRQIMDIWVRREGLKILKQT